jgi:dipeptidyl aminopeptidase/acylaminoacyl peptidase
MVTANHTTDDRRRGLIPEDLLNFRWLDEIALSPNGKRVAYTVRSPHVETNGYMVYLYVQDLNGSTSRRITSGVSQASSIAWSRDSNQLAYSYHDQDGYSVRTWAAADGSQQVYPIDGYPFISLDWSADSRKLAGVRWTPMRHPEDRGAAPAIPAPTIRVIRRLRYKQDGVGWVHDRFTQIWVLELDTGHLLQITNSECDYSSPTWSHKGATLAFVGTSREQNIPPGYGQIFICDFPSGSPRMLLPGWQGSAISPAWGDDDRSIAFAGHNSPPPVNRRNFWQPYLADVAAGAATKLGQDIDEEVGNYAVADQRKGLSNITVKWADGWIYFLLTEQGATNLYRINTSGQYEKLVSGDSVTFEYSPAAGDLVAYGQADPGNPGELYLWTRGTTRRLTDLNPWLRDHRLSVPQAYWYDGLDGAKVHAWLMKPVKFAEGRKYPTIVYVHCSMFSWDFNHEFQIYANAGYAVAYFNQRGTTAGYGQAWTHASEGDQGGKDYREIMLGVDDLIARHGDFIDEERLGVTGGSCGGFMTNWIIGHTDRFAAAVTQRSIVNQISFFGTSDIGPECTEGETGTNPWKDLAASWRQSPIAYAANVKTPLLILHSTEDHRCALEQAEELFAVLRWMGKEVELVIFEGEDHGLSRGGRPGNRIERLRRIVGWFQKHLGTHAVSVKTTESVKGA